MQRRYSVTDLQILLDGIGGPLLLWFALTRSGYGRSAYIAALLYALALPIATAARWQLPDALTCFICLCAVCFPVIWQNWRGAAAAGLALGIGGWFRGDFIGLIPLLAITIWLTKKRSSLS